MKELHPMMYVKFAREPHNPKDENSIVIITQSGQVLGHLKERLLQFWHQ